MVSYGWTIDQALDITLPQMSLLFREMGEYPSPAALIGSLLAGTRNEHEKQAKAALHRVGGGGGEGSVAQVAASEFWKALGLKEPPQERG